MGGFRLGLVAALGLWGCGGPTLDLPGQRLPAPLLELEPAASTSSVPASFRGRLRDAAPEAVPWLLRGALSDYHDRSLRHGELSAALLERAVPVRYWREGHDCWLQPLEWLEAGSDYSLGLVGYGAIALLHVADEAGPRALRFFPPPGAPKHSLEVLCGLSLAADTALSLAPGQSPLQLSPGVFGSPAQDCITLAATQPLLEAAVAPPVLDGILLDPAPFLPLAAKSADAAKPCLAGSLLAEACVEVLDDRIFVTPIAEDQLWRLAAPQPRLLSLRAFERAELLRDLQADTPFELAGEVVSSSGARHALAERLRTLPPRRHLVMSEVLANALGAEPASEWVELVNDSALPASLAGMWLEDAGARVPLPQAELAAGQTALLVAPEFRENGLDVPFPGDALVLELPSLGARGLSNSGEPLLLGGIEGIVSRFPALPAPHAGRSLARRRLDAADDSATSFAEHGAPGASPGAPNSFD